MGTYDTIGGTPRHNPLFDEDLSGLCKDCKHEDACQYLENETWCPKIIKKFEREEEGEKKMYDQMARAWHMHKR